MFIDTHCHLNIFAQREQGEPLTAAHFPMIDAAVQAAGAVGVTTIINVGTSIIESHESIILAQRYSGVYATIGVHPTDCNHLPDNVRDVIQELKLMLGARELNKIIGIGETGLDFYHKPYQQQRQVHYFKAQIELALEHDLPLVIHVREAGDELLRVIEEFIPNGLRGVIHCFQQNLDFAQQVVSWGLMIGIDAPIDYPKNDSLRDVLRQVPLEHMILETDAPFLPPQRLRGKPNSPAYIPIIAAELARIKGVDLAVVEQQTTLNAKRLFRL